MIFGTKCLPLGFGPVGWWACGGEFCPWLGAPDCCGEPLKFIALVARRMSALRARARRPSARPARRPRCPCAKPQRHPNLPARLLTKTLHPDASKTRHPLKNLAPHCKESLILVETTPQSSAALRRDLDQRLPKIASAAASWPKPSIGWIRIIRWALWMSPSELARKLGGSPINAHAARTERDERNHFDAVTEESCKRAGLRCGLCVCSATAPRRIGACASPRHPRKVRSNETPNADDRRKAPHTENRKATNRGPH